MINAEIKELDLAGLPELPADTTGRHQSWVVLMSEPGFKYKGKFYTVNRAFIEGQVAAYAALTDSGYTAPVKREHKSEGVRFGDVQRLASWEAPDGMLRLLAAVAWSFEGAAEAIKSKALKFVSGGFDDITDDRGRKFGDPFVLVEVSMVAAPYLKSAGVDGTMVLFSETGGDMEDEKLEVPSVPTEPGSPAEGEQEPGDMEALTAEVADLRGRLEALEARMPALAEPEHVAEKVHVKPDPVSLSEDQAEIARLKSENVRLAAQVERTLFLSEHGDLAARVEDKADRVFELWRKDRDAFGVLASLRSIEVATTPGGVVPRPKPTSLTGVRLGESGASDIKIGPRTDEELYADAMAQASGDAIQANKIYRALKEGK